MKKTSKWFLFGFLSNILLTSAHRLSAPFFECGPHGRFEYCIDNVPGCVVGCHCHPGYYFDTETKICEANSRLRMTYRRQNVEEPILTIATTEQTPTPTTTSLMDKNIDAIAKDADDLGDWLYNQFFKAIESQVINKTEEKPTRRTGTDTSNDKSTKKPFEKQPKLNIQRRSRRRHIKKPSKKKRSKKGLRRKLLRISEDDSLFDSSSDSSSNSDTSSSSSDSSCESSGERIKNSREDSKRHDHGRKIIMINKKPPLPLPSFIFMPNMETPYFPPLGLPAPPPYPVPMYPMIPVPPVVPPGVPSPTPTTESSGDKKDEHTTEAHTEAAHTTKHTAAPTEAPNTDEPADDAPTEEPPPPDGEEEAATENPGRSRVNKKLRKRKPNMNSRAKQLAKDRFMKKLQEKMMTRYQTEEQSFPHELFDSYLEHNYPDFDQNMRPGYGMHEHPDNIYGELNPHLEHSPYPHNVNFKYLSQLIHKINNTEFQPTPQLTPTHLLQSKLHPNQHPNPPPKVHRILHHNPHQNTSHPYSHKNAHLKLNPNPYSNPQTNPLPNPHPNPNPSPHPDLNTLPNTNVDQIIKSNVNPNPENTGRRSGNTFVFNTVKSDDYANLGKQIAELVRKIDANGDRQIDVHFEGEKTVPNFPPQAIFKDNGFSSRSYWERFARSPFKFNFEEDNMFRISSNEQLQLQQLSLEDQINNAVTTPRPLNLQQLENIVSFMQAIKSARERQMRMERIKRPLQRKSDKNIVRINLKREPDEVKPVYKPRAEEFIYKNGPIKSPPKMPIKVKEALQDKDQKNPHIFPPYILNVHENPHELVKLSNQSGSPGIIQSGYPEIDQGNVHDKSQLQKQNKSHEINEEKLQTNPLYKPKEIPPENSQEKLQPYKMARNTNPQLVSPNLYSPRDIIEESKAIQHKNFNMFALSKQRFKIPLSTLLQNAAIQSNSNKHAIPNRNFPYPKTNKYQQNLNLPPNHHRNNWPDNGGAYRHHENVIKTPSYAYGNTKRPSSFFHQANNFDYFD